MTYRDSPMGEAATLVIGCIVTVALVVLVTLVGWQAGWWFRAQDTNRQAQLDKQGAGYQIPLQIQIGDEIGDVTHLNTQLAANTDPNVIGPMAADRKAIVIRICRQAAQVNPSTPLSGDQAQFVDANCYAGSIAAQSPYN